ncbi:MAG: hypothetical protein ACE149_09305 [Armatimonadota bacterium]
MRRAVWACVSLIVVIGSLSSCCWAVERELSGVRLGDKALALLDRSGYGQPAYIGPLGTISVAPPEQQRQAAEGAAAGGAAARSGPSGPSAAGGAMRGGGMRGGMRGGGARGGGMRGGARGGGMRGGGARGGGMRGGGARGGGMRGGGGRAGGVGAAGGARGRTAGAAAGAEGPGMYWYYRRPGGAVIVLSLNLDGEVTAITLSGASPTPGGRTSRGIGLGNGYMDVIAQYGYPDQTVSSGTALELTYVDHGVRFTLDSMRVREIEIGAAITAAAEAAPAAAAEEAPPPAGMTTEELRGYL